MDYISGFPAPATPAPVASGQNASKSAQGGQGGEFSAMLDGMLTKQGATAANAEASVGDVVNKALAAAGKPQDGLTWREVEALRSLGAVEVGDPNRAGPATLMELLLQLLALLEEAGGQEQDPDGETASEMLGQIRNLQKQLQRMQTETGQLVLSEELLILLAQMSNMQARIDEDGQLQLGMPGGEVNLDQLATMEPETLLQMMSQQLAGTESAPEMNAESTVAQDFDTALHVPKDQPTQTQPVQPQSETNAAQNGGEAKAEMAVDVPVSDVQHTKGTVLDPEADFTNAVRTVKENLNDTAGAAPKLAEEKPKLDVESLQKQVDQGVFFRNTSLSSPAELAPAALVEYPLAEQVESGITAGLATGAQQFSIKLTPEGLGDLTVRLTRAADGGMVLNLVAKNPDTQRMLANEIDLLRQTLRPMKVEVDQVLTEQQDTLLNSQQSFDQNARRQWQELHGAAYYRDEPLKGETEEPQPVSVVQAARPGGLMGALSTYI